MFSHLHVQLTARRRCGPIWPLQQLIPDQLVWPRLPPLSRCRPSNFLLFLSIPPGASLSFPVQLPVGAAILSAGQSGGAVLPRHRRLWLQPEPEPESKHILYLCTHTIGWIPDVSHSPLAAGGMCGGAHVRPSEAVKHSRCDVTSPRDTLRSAQRHKVKGQQMQT